MLFKVEMKDSGKDHGNPRQDDFEMIRFKVRDQMTNPDIIRMYSNYARTFQDHAGGCAKS